MELDWPSVAVGVVITFAGSAAGVMLVFILHDFFTRKAGKLLAKEAEALANRGGDCDGCK